MHINQESAQAMKYGVLCASIESCFFMEPSQYSPVYAKLQQLKVNSVF